MVIEKIIVGIIIVYIKGINIIQNDEKIISNKRKSIFFLREKNKMEILEDSIFMKSSEMIRKAYFLYNFCCTVLRKIVYYA